MKKIITLLSGVLLYTAVQAQCTISGFDVCTTTTSVASFTNPVQVAGTGLPLTVGAKYKFDNVTSGIDAIIRIDKMVNAVMTGSNVTGPSIDDDNAVNETGVIGSQAALFAPRIAPDVPLICSDRTGYVQFTVSFFQHTVGNAMPTVSATIKDPNFLHFDMDGHTVGSNGWFREIGYVQRMSLAPLNPLNLGSTTSLLTVGTLLIDADGTWIRTNGAREERDGVSRCAQVIEKSSYKGQYTTVSFRFGYEYKAPTNCASDHEGMITRQYGSKFGCFDIPTAGLLPVSLTDLAVNYNKGTSTVSWKTLQEINIDKYIIERSTDGMNFEPIGSVVSRNSLLVEKYNYQDNSIPVGAAVLYYRIRIADLDQSLKLTNIVAVRVAASAEHSMVIAPNPARSDVQLKFAAAKNGNATIMIFDAQGKLVFQQPATILAGNNSLSINVSKMTEGVYVVKLTSGGENYSSKLMIWK